MEAVTGRGRGRRRQREGEEDLVKEAVPEPLFLMTSEKLSLDYVINCGLILREAGQKVHPKLSSSISSPLTARRGA